MGWGHLNDGLKPAWIGDFTFHDWFLFPRLFPRFAFATPFLLGLFLMTGDKAKRTTQPP